MSTMKLLGPAFAWLHCKNVQEFPFFWCIPDKVAPQGVFAASGD